jgi:hypothetical protein
MAGSLAELQDDQVPASGCSIVEITHAFPSPLDAARAAFTDQHREVLKLRPRRTGERSLRRKVARVNFCRWVLIEEKATLSQTST